MHPFLKRPVPQLCPHYMLLLPASLPSLVLPTACLLLLLLLPDSRYCLACC